MKLSPMWFLFEQKHQSEQRVALTVAVAFVVAGLAWVVFTNVVLHEITRHVSNASRVETAKQGVFVGLAAVLVYSVTLRSASRLSRARDAISTIFDSIGDGVLVLGPRRTIVHANPAAARMLRCATPRDLVGMGAPEFSDRFRVSYLDGSLVPPRQYVSQRVFDEGGTLRYKAVLHPPSGPEVVIASTAAAVRSKMDMPVEMVVSVMHDITASEQLEHLRDQFFAAAAHSLKTPVAIIKANVQMLSRHAPPELHRSTDSVERQCDRIDRLVQNLLVLARARSKSLRLHQHEVELAPLVERVAREMAKASPQRDVRTEVRAFPRVHADGERLAIALRNLIDEALRSSTLDSSLTVALTQRGAHAIIGVRYQALPPEQRSPATHEEYGDLGISRCVAVTILEAHGADLCEQEAGLETTEWIRLPTSPTRTETSNGAA